MYLSTFQREKRSEKEKWAHSPQPELEEHDRGPGLTLSPRSRGLKNTAQLNHDIILDN